MAASIVIKPAHITHRKLHLQEENRNFPDTVSYMAAVKDTYLEKNAKYQSRTINSNILQSGYYKKFQIFEMIFKGSP